MILSDAEATAESGPRWPRLQPVGTGRFSCLDSRKLHFGCSTHSTNHRMPLDEDAATQSLIGDGCIVSTPLPTAARRGPRRSTLGASSVHTGNLFREGASGRGATASVPG